MIRRGYADSSHGQIHYRECGPSGAPTIVFFHQTASSGAMFEKVMRELADDFHCVALDSPGFGQSFQPESIPDIAYLTDRLMEAIDDLGIDSFHACGHHTGGCAAVEIPARFPGRLLSLAIIGPVVASEEEKAEYRKTFVQPFAIEESGAFLRTAWEYLEMIGAGGDVELQTRELADHLIAHRTMPMAFSAVWNQDVENRLKEVNCALLLMCSERDVLWPLFQRALNLRPDASTCIVGGGDFQPDEDPKGVAKGLAAFISAI